MKDQRRYQTELKQLAVEALQHYEGVISGIKSQLVGLLQRYTFIMFGKKLGLRFPKVAARPSAAAEEATDVFPYSSQFKEMVVCVVRREAPEQHKRIIQTLSKALNLPKSLLYQWVAESVAQDA